MVDFKTIKDNYNTIINFNQLVEGGKFSDKLVVVCNDGVADLVEVGQTCELVELNSGGVCIVDLGDRVFEYLITERFGIYYALGKYTMGKPKKN